MDGNLGPGRVRCQAANNSSREGRRSSAELDQELFDVLGQSGADDLANMARVDGGQRKGRVGGGVRTRAIGSGRIRIVWRRSMRVVDRRLEWVLARMGGLVCMRVLAVLGPRLGLGRRVQSEVDVDDTRGGRHGMGWQRCQFGVRVVLVVRHPHGRERLWGEGGLVVLGGGPEGARATRRSSALQERRHVLAYFPMSLERYCVRCTYYPWTGLSGLEKVRRWNGWCPDHRPP